ncbi:tetratricopeptide repeat protein [Mucilaginibacter angelicae]|uniref:Tetratricopeptide repeat protein n=1 Tax=Mucilaginibacter angelicae TaxID=869718 RepID=A0ABV6KZB6_9SPHI
MEYRKLTILFVLLFAALVTCAQDNKLAVADSTAEQLYNAGDWKQLISFVNKSVTDSVDSPALRFKAGYAYMLTGNYKAAISQFNRVLLKDPHNTTARLYAYYCNTYINNNNAAFYNASHLDAETLRAIKLSPFGVIDAALESGIKLPNNDERDNGFFERAGMGLRLSWRLQLDQSFMLFTQNIFRSGYIDYKNQTGKTDRQVEYYAKSKYSLTKNINLLGAYHYLHTSYRSNTYQSNLGLLGIKYDTRYVDLQGDVNFGKLIDKTLKQYDAKVDFYPLGNLNLYTMSRASVLNLSGTNTFIYSQSVGFKVLDKTWLETAATFGNQDDYLDTDGLYVYNAIDPTKFKCGESVFYQLGNHALLNLNYFYEKKTDVYRAVNYNQNSVTLGITWKF